MSLLINGQWRVGRGEILSKTDPLTAELIWQHPAADSADVADACQAAAEAFDSWAAIGHDARLAVITAFGKQLTEHHQALATLISRETGKPLWESLTEVTAMINKIAISQQSWQQRTGEHQGQGSSLRHRPHGVMAVFGPYNFPGHLPNGQIIPALLAGNTVVFKPSEMTPATAEYTVRLWQQAGLPAGVINLLQGAKQTGQILVDQPQLAGVLFTGSAATGYQIHRQLAGRPEVILALEMGGNNALIAEDMPDIDAAVHITIQSAFISAGQRCTCARRLLVKRGEQGDRFLARLADVTAKLTPGAWDSTPAPFMGSVISPAAAQRIWQHWQQLKQQQGKVIVEMRYPDPSTALLWPGIIDVSEVQGLQDEEVFGPLLTVIRYDHYQEAIRLANQTRFGLACGLISPDEEKFRQLVKCARAGIVNWNKPLTGAASSAPFGGIGASGNHRPGAFYTADICAWPMASLESPQLSLPEQLSPGLDFSPTGAGQ